MTNLCETCRRGLDCLQKGIFEREAYDQYDPVPADELFHRDILMRAVSVGFCPKCGSAERVCDCRDNPLLQDATIGHCMDCDVYWCLECGYTFENVESRAKCPHWDICKQCSAQHSYLDEAGFSERVCPTCEYYDAGCQLEDPSECNRRRHLLCPYENDISEIPEVERFLRKQM